MNVELGPKQLAALDQVSQPRLDFPAEFLEAAGPFAHSGTTVNGTSYPVNPLAPKDDSERHGGFPAKGAIRKLPADYAVR